MKTLSLFAAAALMLAVGSAASLAKAPKGGGNESGPDVKVQFRGCPILSPVEGGCLTVRSGGQTYDINAARPRPNPARRLMISGTGIWQQDTASICMTGKVLTHVKWHYLKTRCPIGARKR